MELLDISDWANFKIELTEKDKDLLGLFKEGTSRAEKSKAWGKALDEFKDEFNLTAKEATAITGLSNFTYFSHRSGRRVPARQTAHSTYLRILRFKKIIEKIIEEREHFAKEIEYESQFEADPLKTKERHKLIALLADGIMTEGRYIMLSKYLGNFVQLKEYLLKLDLEKVPAGKAFKQFLIEEDASLFAMLAPFEQDLAFTQRKADSDAEGEFWQDFLEIQEEVVKKNAD